MSAELIIIIIGIVLFLLGISDTFRSNESSSSIINAKLRIPLGVIGVLLIIYGGFSYGAINLMGQIEQPERGNIKEIDYPVNSVQVLSPVEGDAVSCRVLTMGVYPISHDKDIWVLLKPSDDKYYPQSDHTNTSFKRNGEWQVITRFGGDQGEEFDLIVYEATPQASQFFTSTIEDWKSLELYPGLEEEELPAGAVAVDRIVVSLNENCRGVF